jgi:glutathione S-transferase
MFAALNTVEQPIFDLSFAASWSMTSPGSNAACMRSRRASGSGWSIFPHLGDADWLDGAFSAADILMVTVLRWLQGSGTLEDFSNIAGDVARAEGRPATGGPSTLNLVVFTAASAVG